jgi:hypothetical protein
MKRIVIGMLALAALVIAIGVALAQTRPEVQKKDGHLMPLDVRVTFPNGNTLTGLLCGFRSGAFGLDAKLYHDETFKTPDGGEVKVYLDTLKAISDSNERDALYTFKDGTERRLSTSDPILAIANSQGGVEGVPLSKVKKVEFLKTPRKDKDAHAMFDDWLYSPYTGERLPEN